MRSTKNPKVIRAGGVAQYIAHAPAETRRALKEMRSAIREIAPDAVETTSYFDMPGYSYEGYAYNGMFAWFSYKGATVRLHVRPKAICDFQSALKAYNTSKALVSFPIQGPIPRKLIQKLVKASLKDMINAT